MLKRVQHDKKKRVIPNLFRNLGFGNDKNSIAFVLESSPRSASEEPPLDLPEVQKFLHKSRLVHLLG